jgi:hypothetical protein
VKRKDVQRLALELVDAIDAMRGEMAMQDATIQRQAVVIAELRAALRMARAVPHGCSTGFAPCWCEVAS